MQKTLQPKHQESKVSPRVEVVKLFVAFIFTVGIISLSLNIFFGIGDGFQGTNISPISTLMIGILSLGVIILLVRWFIQETFDLKRKSNILGEISFIIVYIYGLGKTLWLAIECWRALERLGNNNAWRVVTGNDQDAFRYHSYYREYLARTTEVSRMQSFIYGESNAFLRIGVGFLFVIIGIATIVYILWIVGRLVQNSKRSRSEAGQKLKYSNKKDFRKKVKRLINA